MNKSYPKISIIGLLAYAVIASTLIGCENRGQDMVPIYYSKQLKADDIDRLYVVTHFTNVHLMSGQGSQIEIKLDGKINETYKSKISVNMKQEGGKASIIIEEPTNYRDLNAEEHRLDIKIPDRDYKEIELKSASASVEVLAIQAQRFTAGLGQGKGTFTNLISSDAHIRSTTGNMVFTDFQAAGTISTNQGSITLKGQSLSKPLDVESNTSMIDLTQANKPLHWQVHFQSKQGAIIANIPNFINVINTSKELKGYVGGSNGITTNIKTNQGDIKA